MKKENSKKTGIHEPLPEPNWKKRLREQRERFAENEENLKRERDRNGSIDLDMGGMWTGTDKFGNS